MLQDQDVSDKEYFLKKEYLSRHGREEFQTISFNEFKKSFDSLTFRKQTKTYQFQIPIDEEVKRTSSKILKTNPRQSSGKIKHFSHKLKTQQTIDKDSEQQLDKIATLNRNSVFK